MKALHEKDDACPAQDIDVILYGKYIKHEEIARQRP